MAKLLIFAERLAELKGDMSVPEFAEKIGVARQTAGFYLKGDRAPDSEMLCQICQRCGVSADWLLGLPGPETQKEKTTPTAEELEKIAKVLLAVTDYLLSGEPTVREVTLNVLAQELTGLTAEEIGAINNLSETDRAFLSQMVLALAGKKGEA